MVGDGMVVKVEYAKQGDLPGRRDGVHEMKRWSGRSQRAHSSDETGQRLWSEGAQEGGHGMTRRTENASAIVPEGATQAGETVRKWDWVEPSVWTDRMLAALEHGVKGGKWFSLIDKVYFTANLCAAVDKVHSNKGVPGVDHVTVEMFVQDLEANLVKLHTGLREETYHPQAIQRKWIPKPGSKEQRPLGIPTVRDRVAQTALRNVIEPIFERDFAQHSYGFRPGRGCYDAWKHSSSRGMSTS